MASERTTVTTLKRVKKEENEDGALFLSASSIASTQICHRSVALRQAVLVHCLHAGPSIQEAGREAAGTRQKPEARG